MKQLLFAIFTMVFLFSGCVEEAFDDAKSLQSPQAPTGLKYASVSNAREFSVLVSGAPTYNAYGAVPFFEIVAVKDESGNAIPQSVIDEYFMILNYSEETVKVADEFGYVNASGQLITEYTVINSTNIGRILIQTNNPLSLGTYFFDIKMTTTFGDQVFESTFENVFELYMGPALASGLLYVPGGQNLLTSVASAETTVPYVFGANPDYRFELADNTDKFTIDANTGVISLKSGYTASAEPEIVSPAINIISNITDEVVSFSDVVEIYISENPVNIPKLTISLFYPTLEAENIQYGYRVHIVEEGDAAVTWNNLAAQNISGVERPAENANQKRLEINLVRPSAGAQVPHESWAIMNSQDLSSFQFGYDVEAVFYTKNRFVEYLTDGTSPSFIEAYVSTDYLGDFNSATWTNVTDALVSNIESGAGFEEGTEFMGLPYPGDQNLRGLPNPDNLKDPAKNADDKWVKSMLDLGDYIGMTNVTLALRVYTTFDGTIAYDSGGPFDRSGRYLLSDVNITAYEQ